MRHTHGVLDGVVSFLCCCWGALALHTLNPCIPFRAIAHSSINLQMACNVFH